MKFTAEQAKTYYYMMEEREHAKVRTTRIFNTCAPEWNNGIVVNINQADADFFDLLIAEDLYLTLEERELCLLMCKIYEDYKQSKAGNKRQAPKQEEPEPPAPIIDPAVLRYIAKYKHEAVRGCFKDGETYHVELNDGWLAENGAQEIKAAKVTELKAKVKTIQSVNQLFPF